MTDQTPRERVREIINDHDHGPCDGSAPDRTVDRILAVLGSGWQPISTAPKDRRILVWSPTYRESFVAFFATCPDDGDSQWVIARGESVTFIVRDPTLWQEVPAPPSDQIGE
jgi:hypothetical protein